MLKCQPCKLSDSIQKSWNYPNQTNGRPENSGRRQKSLVGNKELGIHCTMRFTEYKGIDDIEPDQEESGRVGVAWARLVWAPSHGKYTYAPATL
ncbi:hypothetical protein Nepgr_009935 [Nepenthes gracilis]|uniref:Uncharacterized protein n=1 Tax=Nepenthes gracilis TaxID=150966 RepID=A0AAD3SCA0_NEPGR|nr:hypothetical protein Nepgr_009935 [Nepenthes gracilis]